MAETLGTVFGGARGVGGSGAQPASGSAQSASNAPLTDISYLFRPPTMPNVGYIPSPPVPPGGGLNWFNVPQQSPTPHGFWSREGIGRDPYFAGQDWPNVPNQYGARTQSLNQVFPSGPALGASSTTGGSAPPPLPEVQPTIQLPITTPAINPWGPEALSSQMGGAFSMPATQQSPATAAPPRFTPVPIAPTRTIAGDANLSGTGPALPAPGGGYLYQPAMSGPETYGQSIDQSNPYKLGSPQFQQWQQERETSERQTNPIYAQGATAAPPPTWMGMAQQQAQSNDSLFSAMAQALKTGFPTTSQYYQFELAPPVLDPVSGRPFPSEPATKQNPFGANDPRYIQWELERMGALQSRGFPIQIPAPVSMYA